MQRVFFDRTAKQRRSNLIKNLYFMIYVYEKHNNH